MIFLREIKTDPWFTCSERIRDFEMHESGFGTVVIDINGFAHHVMENLEEVEEILAKGSNVTVDYEIGIGNRVSPEILSIAKPNNVPSKVRPIVIFPTAEAEIVTVKVTEYDSSGSKMVNTTVNPELSHVINLNTGVE